MTLEELIAHIAAQAKLAPTLFKISDNSGQVHIENEGTAPDIPKAALNTDDCFILPVPEIAFIFVWTGVTTSGVERNQAVKLAVKIKSAMHEFGLFF